MKLIVGLGNPGEGYAHNRHNAGFIVLDQIAGADGWKDKKSFLGQIKEIDGTVYFKPLTFMNHSGDSVAAVKKYYKLANSNVAVIHDELDLPFGSIRTKTGGGSAGHNGVQSIIASIGEDFKRIRIGIRNELAELVEADKFVLSNFTKEEYAQLISSTDSIRKLI